MGRQPIPLDVQARRTCHEHGNEDRRHNADSPRLISTIQAEKPHVNPRIRSTRATPRDRKVALKTQNLPSFGLAAPQLFKPRTAPSAGLVPITCCASPSGQAHGPQFKSACARRYELPVLPS